MNAIDSHSKLSIPELESGKQSRNRVSKKEQIEFHYLFNNNGLGTIQDSIAEVRINFCPFIGINQSIVLFNKFKHSLRIVLIDLNNSINFPNW